MDTLRAPVGREDVHTRRRRTGRRPAAAPVASEPYRGAERRRTVERRRPGADLTVDRSAPRRLGAVLAVLLLGIAVAHLVGTTVPGRISVLDLGAEQSVGTWVSSALHASAAVLAAVAALLARRVHGGRWERSWWLLAAVFAVMSVDEVAAVHDRLLGPVRAALGTTGVFYYAWVIPALALGAVFLLLQIRFLVSLDRSTRLGLLGAGALFVAGAAGMEMAEGWLASVGRRDSLLFDVLVTVEEVAEIGALSLAVCVLLRHVLDTFGTPRLVFSPVAAGPVVPRPRRAAGDPVDAAGPGETSGIGVIRAQGARSGDVDSRDAQVARPRPRRRP